MSTEDRPRGDEDPDQALRDLFAHAAPRPMPPEADAEEIRRAVFAEWDAVTGRRVFRRRVAGAVAAAALVAAVAVLVLPAGMGTGPLPTVATVERVQGNVEVDGIELRVGAAIERGGRVATRSGQVALRLAGGESLRLTTQTELTLLADAEAELAAGALYFDSDGGTASSKFVVQTPYGRLRDIGTQFVARLDPARLELGVRDGRVELARRTDTVAADAGEKVIVPQGAGGVRRESIDIFGPDWAWAEKLAPTFAIEGRHAIDFLEWVAHETGRSLEFASPAAERVAREAELRGVIDLEPLAKLAAVLATIDLDYALEAGRIVIRVK